MRVNRRRFLRSAGITASASGGAGARQGEITLFLGGDTMTGRGIDQIMPHPSAPELYESWLTDARDYVRIAEAANGPVRRQVAFDYVWGDAVAELARMRPAARIVNLETSVTTSTRFEPGKGIHYRMHPENVPCLTAAGIDCCVLANNHVLDWGRDGLKETLNVLHGAHIQTAGAGADIAEAQRPAVLTPAAGGRLLVFGIGVQSSGIPRDWAADHARPGLNFVDHLGPRQMDDVIHSMAAAKRPGDLVITSVHWGGNWGYAIPDEQMEFAHRLIDEVGVDVVYGHSSHHPKAIEVYQGRLVIYGCGDLLNDYEGIRGNEYYRGDLALMYFPTLNSATGALIALRMVPMQIRRLRLNRCAEPDARWLATRLTRESRRFRSRLNRDGAELVLAWEAARS